LVVKHLGIRRLFLTTDSYNGSNMG
jgi:hypothetical protein